MVFSKKFICATHTPSTLECGVPAPLMRRDIELAALPESAKLTVCGLGFYELYVNGKNITRGALSPWITNPNQVLPYDFYDILPYLSVGTNTIAFILGCGMQNATGGYVWSFDTARFSSSPKLAFGLELKINGVYTVTEADESVLTYPSPILFNDLRCGERYDARLEIPGWNLPGFDTSLWQHALPATLPEGEPLEVRANPLKIYRKIHPVSIHREGDSFIYDFGENNTGITELNITCESGRLITLDHGEWLKGGIFCQDNILFRNDASRGKPRITQRVEYVTRGGGESYMPTFTFFGFRYVRVSGISESEAVPELLTYHVISSLSERRSSFDCSDEDLCRLYDMTMRSVISNFIHFPMDCPHREKNGWTADAALTSSLALMSFNPENNYLTWVRCIARAMTEDGVLPGIVPTDRWGYTGCNGPAWDSALIWLPYWCIYLRGDERPARAVSGAILKYIHYLNRIKDSRGLITTGLGDHCAPNEMAPNTVTSSIISYDLGIKAAYIFERLGMPLEAEYCRGFAAAMRAAVRAHLIEDAEGLTVSGRCQTSQAMALYYGIFEGGEYKTAYATLRTLISEKGDHLAVGCLGARVLFRVLCDNGDSDLAIRMITRRDPPSYGFLIDEGHTTLAEKLVPSENSFNHHFFGDIAAVMTEYFAGIRPNPHGTDPSEILISPTFPPSLSHASATYSAPGGRVSVRWQRTGEGIELEVSADEGVKVVLAEQAVREALPRNELQLDSPH